VVIKQANVRHLLVLGLFAEKGIQVDVLLVDAVILPKRIQLLPLLFQQTRIAAFYNGLARMGLLADRWGNGNPFLGSVHEAAGQRKYPSKDQSMEAMVQKHPGRNYSKQAC